MSIQLSWLLAAIAAVESNSNPLAIGKHGELSAYQMTREVWETYAKPDVEPFATASTPHGEPAAQIAELHLIALNKQLHAAGVPVTVANLAAAWHEGAHGAIQHALHHTPPSDYAQRVANLYADAEAKAPRRIVIPAHLLP